MGLKIVIPSYLQSFTNTMETAEVKGSTVGECLDNLTKQFPSIEKMLFAKNGKLLNYVGIYINGEDTYLDELVKPVRDGDELHIQYIIGGG